MNAKSPNQEANPQGSITSKPNLGRFYNINPSQPKLALSPSFVVTEGEATLCARWSGSGFESPPSVGSRVRVSCNTLGPGLVTGYFIEAGWLGIYVKLDEASRPEWHKKQNPNRDFCMVFGAEIKPLEVA